MLSLFAGVRRAVAFGLVTLWLAPVAHADMQPMLDEDLSAVTGQALFVADKITPNSLAGAGGAGSSTDFTYYRIGLDAVLEMNLNIDRLRLGCGGVNDNLVAGVCDIDLEYVRFMGKCTTPNCGQSTGGITQFGSGAPVTSDFKLVRPYLEMAIKNDGSKTQREVVGIKIGAQTADGYVGIGGVNGDPGNVNNHFGINAISGYLGASMSAYLTVDSDLGGGNLCAGRPTGYAACNAYPTPMVNIPAARTTGTRMTELQAPDTLLCCLHGAGGLLALFSGQDMYLNLREDLRFLHGFTMDNTNDFFISMQRQQVRYPVYNKTGYAAQANTGWWMNVPSAQLKDLLTPTVDLGCPGGFLCLGALDAFNSPGLFLQNVDLGSRAVRNCFGTTEFC